MMNILKREKIFLRIVLACLGLSSVSIIAGIIFKSLTIFVIAICFIGIGIIANLLRP